MFKRYSKLLKILLTILVLVLFVSYMRKNLGDFKKLLHIPVYMILLILLAQFVIFLSNTFIISAQVRLDKKEIGYFESFKVNAYSSLINFFGFLQAGVGYRAVYLNKTKKIRYGTYVLLMLIQYGLVFGFSSLLIIFGYAIIKSNLLLALIPAVLAMIFILVFRYLLKKKYGSDTKISKIIDTIRLSLNNKSSVVLLAILVLIQLSAALVAYGLELHAVGASINLGGLLIYTGLAQFSILFALTPGAIGIREGMLLTVQSVMSISGHDIILASSVDRLVFFLLLLLLLPIGIIQKRALPSSQN